MGSMTHEERAARNEAVFREVNERIKSLSGELAGNDGETFSILCECSRDTCTELVRIKPDEYEAVRRRGARFAIVAGHEDETVERVVEQNERFAVVEKLPGGAEIAEQLDPRANPSE